MCLRFYNCTPLLQSVGAQLEPWSHKKDHLVCSVFMKVSCELTRELKLRLENIARQWEHIADRISLRIAQLVFESAQVVRCT